MAVILAAGLGTRLQAVQADRPKGFVTMAGEPIIARSVRTLRAAGIEQFVFVVGWQSESYRAWAATEVPGVRFVDNPAYATTGSLRSLLLGAAAVRGRDVVVVESDLLYERRAVTALLAAPDRDTVLVSGFTGSRDEVWVYADAAGRLARLTKRASGRPAPVGELVGLSRLSAPLLEKLTHVAATLPAAAHYEDGLTAVASSHPVALVRLDDLAWCEIDDPAHLARAAREIWPRIAAADASPLVSP